MAPRAGPRPLKCLTKAPAPAPGRVSFSGVVPCPCRPGIGRTLAATPAALQHNATQRRSSSSAPPRGCAPVQGTHTHTHSAPVPCACRWQQQQRQSRRDGRPPALARLRRATSVVGRLRQAAHSTDGWRDVTAPWCGAARRGVRGTVDARHAPPPTNRGECVGVETARSGRGGWSATAQGGGGSRLDAMTGYALDGGWGGGAGGGISAPIPVYAGAPSLRALFLSDQQILASGQALFAREPLELAQPLAVQQQQQQQQQQQRRASLAPPGQQQQGGLSLGTAPRAGPPRHLHPHPAPHDGDGGGVGVGVDVGGSNSSGKGLGGWGGQAIRKSAGFRAPNFGRSRLGKGGGGHHGQGPRSGCGPGRHEPPHLGWAGGEGGGGQCAAGSHRAGGDANGDFISVEEACRLIKRLPRNEPFPERVYRGQYLLDSRAVSVLLKDLSKGFLDYRAVELFDWLRKLDRRHPLSPLCDVYTYTAMISICKDVGRAVELFDEMQDRSVERNVHSYTALMNVCIKCRELGLALKVYASMRRAGCSPNVVTFNTLIDVYGKLGQWEMSVHMLDVMKREASGSHKVLLLFLMLSWLCLLRCSLLLAVRCSLLVFQCVAFVCLQGIHPVLRTFNTLIIACNMCSQPREALSVYQEMIAKGFTANSTTSNALISAFGKLGMLDKVLEVYQEMVCKGLDRSVITYSSLISACEKAGKWEIALKLFDEMKKDGCEPNTVTYNSLITACAQGIMILKWLGTLSFARGRYLQDVLRL